MEWYRRHWISSSSMPHHRLRWAVSACFPPILDTGWEEIQKSGVLLVDLLEDLQGWMGSTVYLFPLDAWYIENYMVHVRLIHVTLIICNAYYIMRYSALSNARIKQAFISVTEILYLNYILFCFVLMILLGGIGCSFWYSIQLTFLTLRWCYWHLVETRIP